MASSQILHRCTARSPRPWCPSEGPHEDQTIRSTRDWRHTEDCPFRSARNRTKFQTVGAWPVRSFLLMPRSRSWCGVLLKFGATGGCLHDCSPDDFRDLRDDGISERFKSVQPIGYPISHSTHGGINCPPPIPLIHSPLSLSPLCPTSL